MSDVKPIEAIRSRFNEVKKSCRKLGQSAASRNIHEDLCNELHETARFLVDLCNRVEQLEYRIAQLEGNSQSG